MRIVQALLSDKFMPRSVRLGKLARAIRPRLGSLGGVFVALGETMLISHFKSLWSVVLDGFGNNPPGKGRAARQRPKWHILHPGGTWASELAETRAKKEIEAAVNEHFRTTPIPPSELKLTP